MKYIADLREGEMISEIYLCKFKQIAKTKAGKSYYSMILQDKTGTIDAKVWELTNGIGAFEMMDYIKIDGQVTSFQNALQLNVRRIRKAEEGEYEPKDFLPVSEKNIEEMYRELMTYASSIKDEKIKKLVYSFFAEDKEFVKKFKMHSAAKSVHHGFVGGLLEHTLGVVKLCDYYAKTYPMIQRDILISAAMFHDIGKLEELSAFPENDYTEGGQLLGHIVIGVEKLGERIRTIPGFSPKVANELKHCIVAHHGEYEFGSPKKPATAEALALNLADNTDAKMETMKEYLNSADEKIEWLGFNRLFDSNIMRSSI